MRIMGLLGDFTQAILLITVACWILSIISLAVTGHSFLATMLIIGFIIPLSMIAYAYMKNRKDARAESSVMASPSCF